jgi:hypothetical protein
MGRGRENRQSQIRRYFRTAMCHRYCSHNAPKKTATTIRRTLNNLSNDRHVRFASRTQIHHYNSHATTPLITFDSGADSHYLSETDRLVAGLPILRPSSRQVGVTNGSTSTARYISQLPFPQLSPNAVLATRLLISHSHS